METQHDLNKLFAEGFTEVLTLCKIQAKNIDALSTQIHLLLQMVVDLKQRVRQLEELNPLA
jgi:hypothetical protein